MAADVWLPLVILRRLVALPMVASNLARQQLPHAAWARLSRYPPPADPPLVVLLRTRERPWSRSDQHIQTDSPRKSWHESP